MKKIDFAGIIDVGEQVTKATEAYEMADKRLGTLATWTLLLWPVAAVVLWFGIKLFCK